SWLPQPPSSTPRQARRQVPAARWPRSTWQRRYPVRSRGCWEAPRSRAPRSRAARSRLLEIRGRGVAAQQDAVTDRLLAQAHLGADVDSGDPVLLPDALEV